MNRQEYGKLADAEIASIKQLAVAMGKLSKAQPVATNAVKAIEKYVSPIKNSLAQYALADVKKEIKKLMADIQTVDDYNLEILAQARAVKKAKRSVIESADIVDLKEIVDTYCPTFIDYFREWKLEINKL
jgi:GTP1/Obg family GTP-binding protein